MQIVPEGKTQSSRRKPADVNTRLQEALAEREQFLKARPHMRSYQREIDNLLDKSGNHQGRMAVLSTLMQGKLLEIQRELHALSKLIQVSIS